MIDLKFLRENPEAVKENIKKKFQEEKLPLVDQVLALDAENRRTIQEAQDLRTARNALSKRDDHDEFPKTNFHNDPIPFLCRCGCAALLGAKMCRSLFARCLFCPDLRGFGAVCAFAATLIPKFGGLNMNLF